MKTNTLLVAMALLLSLTLLHGPTVSGQEYGHYAGCYDELCNQFTRCWSTAANTYWKAKARCDKEMRDKMKLCDPGSAGEFCRVGARLAKRICLIPPGKTYCLDRSNCCWYKNPGRPHPGSWPCYYYDNNCPAACYA